MEPGDIDDVSAISRQAAGDLSKRHPKPVPMLTFMWLEGRFPMTWFEVCVLFRKSLDGPKGNQQESYTNLGSAILLLDEQPHPPKLFNTAMG